MLSSFSHALLMNMSFNLCEQRSLLDYLKRDPSLPEELVDLLSKLEMSIAKLTNTVCVYDFNYLYFLADLILVSQIVLSHFVVT